MSAAISRARQAEVQIPQAAGRAACRARRRTIPNIKRRSAMRTAISAPPHWRSRSMHRRQFDIAGRRSPGWKRRRARARSAGRNDERSHQSARLAGRCVSCRWRTISAARAPSGSSEERMIEDAMAARSQRYGSQGTLGDHGTRACRSRYPVESAGSRSGQARSRSCCGSGHHSARSRQPAVAWRSRPHRDRRLPKIV